jgi:hypothetical protein
VYKNAQLYKIYNKKKMNSNNTSDSEVKSELEKNVITKVNFFHVPIKKAGKDIRLNVSFKEALIRFGITLILPIIILLINARLMIYTAPVMAYLFLSGITHFCVIKYFWRRFIKHEPPEPLPPYGQDMNYPEESV